MTVLPSLLSFTYLGYKFLQRVGREERDARSKSPQIGYLRLLLLLVPQRMPSLPYGQLSALASGLENQKMMAPEEK